MTNFNNINILAEVIFIYLFIFSVVNIFIFFVSYFKNLEIKKKLRKLINSLSENIDKLLKKVSILPIFKNNFTAIITLETISSVIYHKWLSLDVFISGDHHWVYSRALSYFQFPTAWTALISLGEPNWSLWNTYYASFLGFFGSLGLDGNVVNNIFIFWFIIFMAPVISFLFARKFSNNIFISFIFSLLFLFNSYVLTNIVAGHLLLSVSFYFAILSFLAYIIFIESKFKKTHFLIISAVVSCITGSIDFRIFYLLLAILIIYQFLYLLLNKVKISFREFILKNLLFFLILFLLNLNWLLPTIFIKESNAILGRNIFAKGLIDLFNSWSGTYYYWSISNRIIWGVDIDFPIIFMVLPLLAIMVFYFSKKTNSLIIFTMLFLIGSFFGKQNTAPFSRIYEFMFYNFPGFSAFRDATKFFQIVWWSLPIIYIVGYENTKNKLVRITLIFFVVLITYLNIFSLLKYQDHLLTSTAIPDYYHDLLKIEDGSFGRILWIPRHERFFVASSDNPRIGLHDVKDTSWLLSLNDNEKNSSKSALLKGKEKKYDTNNILNNENFKQLVVMSSVKYLVVPKQLQNYNQFIDDDSFYYGDDRNEIIKILDSLNWLKKVEITDTDASIYKPIVFRPHFYLTDEIETFKNMFELKITEVKSDFINPSIYSIHLRNIKDTVYLTFTDSYSDQWIIGPRFNSIINFAMWKDPDSFLKNKYKNEAGENVFKINRDILIGVTNDYEENQDGSINADLTIYYSPQKQLIWGNAISIMTYLLVVIYFVRFFIKKQ